MNETGSGYGRRGRAHTLVPWAFAAFAVAGLLYAVPHWRNPVHWVSTNDAYVVGNVITLTAQTDGTVVEIRTENTREVKVGEVLVKLDKTRAALALEEARAVLADAVREVVGLFRKAEKDRQAIVVANATLTRLEHDLVRYRRAVAEEAIPARLVQNTEDRIRELSATIELTTMELQIAESRISGTRVQTHPAVLRSAAVVRQRYLELVRNEIRAPVGGIISRRKVQLGDLVKPGTPLLAIVPLDDVWVEANLKETQIAGVRPGASADVEVDTLTGARLYHGTVEGVHPGTGSVFALLPPENAAGNFVHIVERVPVRIRLSSAELKAHPLSQGLSAEISIHLEGPLDPGPAPELNGNAYHTAVYESELAGVDGDIAKIIADNMRRVPVSNAPR